jgi:ABC-2 type transport system permease protein
VSAVGALLRPRLLGPRNRWRRADGSTRARAALLALFGLGLWAAIYVFFVRVLVAFQGIEEIGPVLVERLLGMLLLTFFSILLFSNVVTALSSYFLASDLVLLRALPIDPARLHLARFLETLWDSSWMILSFGLPVFLAFGATHGAGPLYYASAVAVLAPFVVLPTAIGVTLTLLLVRFFPARRTNDVFLLLSGIAIGVLFVLLRSLRPEQLVRPEAFADFTDFLADVQTPKSPFLPSAWAAEVLVAALGLGGSSPVFSWVCLATTAAAAYVVCEMLSERLYAEGWSRAQEGRHARLSRLPFWDRAIRRLPFLSPVARALVLKDAKTFFRDTTQWSQLVLLAALIVVYVYNFRVLPSAGSFFAQAYLTRALGFLNLALASFVVASVAVRFVFPGISLEGKAFWVVKSAPIRLRALWWSKFWMGFLPLVTLGLLLLVASDRMLEVGPEMTALSVATLALLTAALTAMGLAFGAAFPQLEYENAAQIPSSFGGAAYMVAAVSFIFANVALEAWPMFRLLRAELVGRPLGPDDWMPVAGCFAAVLLLDLGVLVASARSGIRRLEALEP